MKGCSHKPRSPAATRSCIWPWRGPRREPTPTTPWLWSSGTDTGLCLQSRGNALCRFEPVGLSRSHMGQGSSARLNRQDGQRELAELTGLRKGASPRTRGASGQLEAPGSRWLCSHLKTSSLKAQEEPGFLFQSTGREKPTARFEGSQAGRMSLLGGVLASQFTQAFN